MASLISTKDEFIANYNIKPGESLNSISLNRNENKLKDELNLMYAYQKYLTFGDKSRIPVWVNRPELYQQDSLVLHNDIPYYALTDVPGTTEPGTVVAETKWLVLHNSTILKLMEVAGDLTGFLKDEKSKSSITYDDVTNVLSLNILNDITVYKHGKDYPLKTTDTYTIDLSTHTGGFYIGLDPIEKELYVVGPIPDFGKDLLVAYVYKNESEIIILGDERHGAEVDSSWHASHHFDNGAVWRTGGSLSYGLNDDTNISVGVSTPLVIADEDLVHTIIHNDSPTNPYEQILNIANLPVLYVSNNLYQQIPGDVIPWVSGTLAQYNDVNTGTLVDAIEGQYISYYLVATNDQLFPVKLIVGRQAYNTEAEASQETFEDYGLPLPEIVPMYKIIIHTSSTYNNAKKVVINKVYRLTNRESSLQNNLSPSNHNSLSGRDLSDQHPISSITNLQDILSTIGANVTNKVEKTSDTGSALLPTGTTSQRDLTPIDGMIRYNSETLGFEGYFNGQWQSVGGGQMLGQSLIKTISYNAQVINENITITSGLNAYSVGDVTINNGYSVVIEDNAIYKIL